MLLSKSAQFFAMPPHYYEMTDTQSIKSMCVHTTVMLDCMQLKVNIIIFHAQSIDL